ncbi:hypothetical protein BCR36DRAFT_457029 [Piromyces finnis]|uniref:Uncharacterized protein n=1 Tax=Piromyces finnis TaxID=1754191 RepID=A0A1Y1VKU7_9FUNG|nr:hypothetical protein BCR36DRAFT_457029 [Piromyces finnis]|eukprot:ORX58379.1 hypothetical protein BCR36DRAFT_457029 [Piromyces finnis]
MMRVAMNCILLIYHHYQPYFHQVFLYILNKKNDILYIIYVVLYHFIPFH